MAQTTPTIADISANITAQLESSLGQTIPILPKAFLRVLAKVLAAVFVLVFKYAGWMFLQWFVAYASFQETTANGRTFVPLIEWGRLIGVGDPTAATRAELTVTVTVKTIDASKSLAASTLLLRSETGFVYSVVAAVPLDAATVTATIQAVDDDSGTDGLGTGGNLQVGDQLSFANPPAYVERVVTVASVVTTAADAEGESSYRARVIRRFQRRPQGGAYADYQSWAEEVEGVKAAFPYTGDPGEVDVYIEADTSIDPDGIPTSALLAAVETSILYDDEGLPTRRPAGAAVNVLAITRKSLDVEVTGLVVDDSATVVDDMRDAVDEHLRSLAPYIEGLSVLPRADRALLWDVSGIVSDTVRAAGGTFGAVVLMDGSDEITAYTLTTGELVKLGTLSAP